MPNSIKITSGKYGVSIEDEASKGCILVLSHDNGTISISPAANIFINVTKVQFDLWVKGLSNITV